jgi:phytoene/squalene synthetase
VEDAFAVSRDTSFYYSFLVLPDTQRDAIVTVWDACRAIDDAVDEAADEAQAVRQIGFWRDEIARVFERGEAQSPQGRALVPVARRFDLPRRSFDDLIDGVAMDLGHRRYETFDDLREYCWRVPPPGRPRLRDEPRPRAAAHEHRARREDRPGPRPRLLAAGRTAPFRLQ